MSSSSNPDTKISGLVAKILDDGRRLVINRGKEHGVRSNFRFRVFRDDGEVTDPETGESLGNLQSEWGYGKVVKVQDKMSVIEYIDPASDRMSFPQLATLTTSVDEILGRKRPPERASFLGVSVGDVVVQR